MSDLIFNHSQVMNTFTRGRVFSLVLFISIVAWCAATNSRMVHGWTWREASIRRVKVRLEYALCTSFLYPSSAPSCQSGQCVFCQSGGTWLGLWKNYYRRVWGALCLYFFLVPCWLTCTYYIAHVPRRPRRCQSSGNCAWMAVDARKTTFTIER